MSYVLFLKRVGIKSTNLTNLPAISWYVLVMMKSVAFIEIKSAVN